MNINFSLLSIKQGDKYKPFFLLAKNYNLK